LLGPLELANGDIAIARINAVTPAKAKPLAEVKDKLIADWRAEKRREKNLLLTKAGYGELVEGKTTLEKLASSRGTNLNNLAGITRTQKDLPQEIDRAVWLRLFEVGINKPFMQPVKDGILIAVVTRAQLPAADETAPTAKGAREIIDQLTSEQREEAISQYMGALNERYDARVNDRLLRQMFAPKTSDGE